MKRFISLLIAVLLILCTSGCTNPPADTSSKLSVVSTIFPGYDFAKAIAGDKADVHMLIPPGSETHGYEPTTSDILKITECDVFIYTAGESDNWITELLKNSISDDTKVISLIESAQCDEDTHSDHSHAGHHHSGVDEHVWTSPVHSMKIAQSVCDALCEKDTANADYYKGNLDTLLGELTALDEDFREITKNGKRNLWVFADRYPLTHFSDEYSLEYEAAFSGCSEDTEPSAATVAHLIDTVNEHNIPVVLKIELSSDEIAKTISRETGAEILTFYSCHNISKDDFENGETYVSLMQKNVVTLSKALN